MRSLFLLLQKRCRRKKTKGRPQRKQQKPERQRKLYGQKDLYDQLAAAYVIGWPVTEEMTEAYPYIVPAQGEKDTGVAISFDIPQAQSPLQAPVLPEMCYNGPEIFCEKLKSDFLKGVCSYV